MASIRTAFNATLIPALIALPFWGVFGFVMVWLVAVVGSAWLMFEPYFRD